MSKNIVLFGATGSIGDSVLNVLNESNAEFNLSAVTCNNNYEKISHIASKFNCKNIGIANNYIYKSEKKYLTNTNIVFGINNFDEFINDNVDIYILAISGIVCAELALKLAKTGKIFAIANKETLISLGKILIDISVKYKTKIFPLDSEHNSIYQLIENSNFVYKDIVLTASGGPFLNLPINKLKNVTPQQAVLHPKWKMGKKISVDSSNLMNKSLEVIEAKNLFNLNYEKISAIIHPQSIIHGIVNFEDNSSFAFLSQPQMEISISSLFFPKKDIKSNSHNLNLIKSGSLDFFEIDENRFPAYKLGKLIMELDGIAPHLFNYNNEILVDMFLNGEINYTDIIIYNEIILEKFFKLNQNIESPSITDITNVSNWVNENLTEIINYDI